MFTTSKYKHTLRMLVKKYILNSYDSNKKLSFSVGIGVFSSVLPIWGFQTMLAIALAFILKTNKVISVAASNISQPPLTPFIIFISYLVGAEIFGGDLSQKYSSFSVDNCIREYILGSIVTAVVLAIISGMLTYTLLSFFQK